MFVGIVMAKEERERMRKEERDIKRTILRKRERETKCVWFRMKERERVKEGVCVFYSVRMK